jgi:hypothetical protein
MSIVTQKVTKSDITDYLHKLQGLDFKPVFPLNGNDIMKKDYTGPEIKHKLIQLENSWIDSFFKASKSELLNKI